MYPRYPAPTLLSFYFSPSCIQYSSSRETLWLRPQTRPQERLPDSVFCYLEDCEGGSILWSATTPPLAHKIGSILAFKNFTNFPGRRGEWGWISLFYLLRRDFFYTSNISFFRKVKKFDFLNYKWTLFIYMKGLLLGFHHMSSKLNTYT